MRTVTVRLPAKIRGLVTALSKHEGRSITRQVEQLVREALVARNLLVMAPVQADCEPNEQNNAPA